MTYWAVVFVAIVSRRIDQVCTPQFYAEDGTRFFFEAIRYGWASILMPINSHLNVGPRIVACLLRPIPWEVMPFAYVLASGALTALVSLRVATAEIPRAAAVVGGLAVVVVPTAGELYLNLCCLHFLTAILLAVNLLEPVPNNSRWSLRRGVEMAISALSGPEVIIAVPLAIFRMRRWLRCKSARWALLAFGIGAAIQIGTVVAHPRGDPMNAVPHWIIIPVYTKWLFTHWYWNRVFMPGYSLALAIALSFIAMFYSNRYRGEASILLLGALLYLMAARAVAPIWPNPFGDGSRYVFVPFVFVLWSLGWLWSGASLPGQRMLAGILMTAILASGAASWFGRTLPDEGWRKQVDEYRRGQRTEFTISGPVPWTFPVPEPEKR